MNRIINKPIIPMCDQLNNNKNNQISISQRELLQKQRNGTNSTSRQTMKKKLSLGLLTSSCYCIFIMFLLSVSIVTSFTINNVNSVRSNTRYLSSPVTTQNNNNQNLIILQMMNDDDKKKKSNSKGGGFGGTGSTAAAGSSTTTKTTTTTSTSKRGVRQPKSTGSNFVYSGTTRPGKISTQKVVVDSNIIKPDYYNTGIPIKTGKMMFPWMIEVKTSEEINKMKQSGILARHILDYAGTLVNQPGITTDDIDHAVHNEIIKNGAYPSPLNYHGFPKSCCTSLNEVICHGIPDNTILKKGDIINIDITVYLNGYHGDCSEMFVVGDYNIDIDEKTKTLLQVTYDCWISACQIVKPGVEYKEIGTIIEDYITPYGLSTIKQFCGHGVGSVFHTNPNILHYRNNEPNGLMDVGHTFTIEPMICLGSAKNVITWNDQWTATTSDGLNTAQFEHTLLITSDGVEALTGKNENSKIQFWERNSKVHQGIWLGTSNDAIQRMNEINSKLL